MTLTSRDIVEVLKTARELGYKEFQLELDGLRLSASSAIRSSDAAATASVAGSAAASSTPSTSPSGTSAHGLAGAATSTAGTPASRAGLVAVNAPMSGIFYRSPAPGEPPFVEVGSRVGAGDIICIIEVMKLFNSIRAGTVGVIAEIAVDNEGNVVAGQPVIWIKPTNA